MLIADDNEDLAEGLEMVLTSLGHQVRTAHDGPSALELAERFRPEALVLDIGMPKMSGHEVCRQIRMQPWGTDIVVIALTGWARADDQGRSFEAGFDHYVVKPVDSASLVALLERRRPVR